MAFSLEDLPNIIADVKGKLVEACINTVNIQVALTRQNAIQNIQNQFTLRNNWTLKNISYKACKPNIIRLNSVKAEVGATDKIPYMERQEKGGEHKAKNSKLPIPMTQARGGSNSNQVLKRFRLSKIGIVTGEFTNPRAVTKKQKFVARAFIASQEKHLLTSEKNFFQILRFKKKGDKISFKMKPLYNVKFSQTTTSASPWLRPATEKPTEDGQAIFNQQADRIFQGLNQSID